MQLLTNVVLTCPVWQLEMASCNSVDVFMHTLPCMLFHGCIQIDHVRVSLADLMSRYCPRVSRSRYKVGDLLVVVSSELMTVPLYIFAIKKCLYL